jgi:DNA-binding SARP family transcriptional activator/nucleoid-associated protein YgaU
MRDTAKAAMRLVGGVALLAGIPLALVMTVGWPLPRVVPAFDELREAFDRRGVPTEVLVKTLAVIMWAAWAQLVIGVVIETIAAARGRQARRAPLLPGLQLLARQFVASAALVMSLLGPLRPANAAAAPLSHLEDIHHELTPAPAPPPIPAPPVTSPHDSPTGDYVVQRGDSYWGLAREHLGDGSRWRDMRDANVGRTVAPGRVIGAQDDDLRPGWSIRLPVTGAAPASKPAANTRKSAPLAGASDGPISQPVTRTEPGPAVAEPAAAGEVTVVVGDDFWQIAERELSERLGRAPTTEEIAPYWRQLVEANRTRLAPPGDPNLIYPGQHFVTPPVAGSPPASAGPPPTPSAPPARPSAPVPPPPPVQDPPAPPASSAAAPPASSAPAPPASSAPAPRAEEPVPAPPAGADATRPGDGGPVPETTAPPDPGQPRAPTSPAPPPPPTESGDTVSELVRPVGLAGGGVALAGLVLLLDRRRRAQQRHRRRGRRIAVPPPRLAHSETELRAGADIAAARLVDVALRAAAAGCGSTGLPALRWVEGSADSVLLVLASPASPPPGFSAASTDRWRTAVPPAELARFAGGAASPAPTLVPVGVADDGADLLVELEASGVATVSGPVDLATGFLRGLAVAAATVPWSEQPQVILAGMSGELCALPWVTASPSLTDALETAEAHAERTAAALQSTQAATTAQARAAGAVPDAWDPLVVLSACEPHELDDRRLTTLAERPHHAVAVVTPPGAAAATGRSFVLDEAGLLRIDGVDATAHARLLDETDARVVVEVLDIAARLDDTPPAEDMPTPRGAPAETKPAAGPGCLETLRDELDVVVRVLGEVEAVRIGAAGTEERLTPERQKGLEALTYLALRESAVDREDLEITLFPTGANATKTFHNTVSAARRLIGDDLFPPSTGGRYELSERVVTDYGLFCDLVARAEDIDDVTRAAAMLQEALGLVRGEPFTGVGRSYGWVSSHRGMIVAQVVDAAEELAEVRLATGDWRSAEWAARQGLLAFPCDERMYRLLMRTAAAAGNVSGVQRAFRELCDMVADPDSGVEPEDTIHPETVALLEQLTGSARHQMGA